MQHKQADEVPLAMPAFNDGPWLIRETRLVPKNSFAGDGFGRTLAIAPGLLAVGSGERRVSSAAGAVHLFEGSGHDWVEAQHIDSDSLGIDNTFGWTVALNDDTLFVGTPGEEGGGRVDVFYEQGGSWQPSQTLVPESVVGEFGITLAATNEFLLVGTPIDTATKSAIFNTLCGGPGTVQAYRREGDQWVFEQELSMGSEADGHRFGDQILLESERALIGAPGCGEGRPVGTVYVYKREASGWSLSTSFQAPSPFEGDDFGRALAQNEHMVLVGAPAARPLEPGAVYGYPANLSDTSNPVPIAHNEPDARDVYGWSVGFAADLVLATHQESISSSLHVLTQTDGTWTEQARLIPNVDWHEYSFGSTMVTQGAFAFVGSDYPVYYVDGEPTEGIVFIYSFGLPLGESCTRGELCDSGFCVDGVCCNSPCGGDSLDDCRACSAMAGAAADGECTDLPDETQCAVTSACVGTCNAGACEAPETNAASVACQPDDPTPEETAGAGNLPGEPGEPNSTLPTDADLEDLIAEACDAGDCSDLLEQTGLTEEELVDLIDNSGGSASIASNDDEDTTNTNNGGGCRLNTVANGNGWWTTLAMFGLLVTLRRRRAVVTD